MSDYDVIVVGGGPAGSTTARRASQKGLNVLLFDKATFPRVKACGGGIGDRGVNMLDFDIDDIVHRRPYGPRFFSPSGIAADCTRPKQAGVLIMRTEFDTLLLRKAQEAGADVREGIKVIDADQDENGVIVKTGKGEEFKGKFMVGADGINGIVARKIGFYSSWPADAAAVTIEIEVEVGEEVVEQICGVPYDRKGVAFHIYFGVVPYGYVWCFPKRSILSIGAGCLQSKAKNIRHHFNQWFEKFKIQHNLDPQIVSDTAFRIPFVGAAKKTVIGRTILTGDAAGFVIPFSGEGIYLAIQSGIIAASVLDKAVKHSDPSLLREYERTWKKEFGDDLKAAKSIAKLMFKNEKNMETICRLAAEDEVVNEITYSMISGLDTYKNLRRALIKRIGLKHTREGLSLYT